MNEMTANDDILKEKIIQDLVAGCSISQAAAAYGVELDYIEAILKLPRFSGSGSNNHRKAVQLARIDAATKALMPGVQAGNHDDIDMWLKVAKREAALTGLDAPQKVEGDMKLEVVLKYSNPAFNQQPLEVTDVTPIEHVTAPPSTIQEIAAAHQSHLDANKAAREHDKAHPKPWLDKPPEPKAAPGVVFRTPPTPGVLANPSGGKPD